MNPFAVRFNSLGHNVTSLPHLYADTDTVYVPIAHFEARVAELQSLIESLTERCHQQSELLSKRAEADPLRAAALRVYEALRRMTTYEDCTLTQAGCRDALAEALGIKSEANYSPETGKVGAT